MGQSNPSLPMAERVWHLADLLNRMIERVGVSGAAGRLDGGEGLRQAARNCMRCRATVACERFLAEADAEVGIPAFCPNRVFLGRCLQMTSSPACPATDDVGRDQ